MSIQFVNMDLYNSQRLRTQNNLHNTNSSSQPSQIGFKKISENINQKRLRIELDSATKFPTELVNIIESCLFDIPLTPRNPGKKAGDPLAGLSTDERICLVATPIIKKLSITLAPLIDFKKVNQEKIRIKLDSATKFPTELINIIESCLFDIPLTLRKPGEKTEDPLAGISTGERICPVDERIHQIAMSSFKNLPLPLHRFSIS